MSKENNANICMENACIGLIKSHDKTSEQYVFTISLVIKLSTELLLIASLYNSILFLY